MDIRPNNNNNNNNTNNNNNNNNNTNNNNNNNIQFRFSGLNNLEFDMQAHTQALFLMDIYTNIRTVNRIENTIYHSLLFSKTQPHKNCQKTTKLARQVKICEQQPLTF